MVLLWDFTPIAYYVIELCAAVSALLAAIFMAFIWPSVKKTASSGTEAVLKSIVLYLGITAVLTLIGTFIIFQTG
jgi:ABC-type polysaccharide/polyol phosphate export permease